MAPLPGLPEPDGYLLQQAFDPLGHWVDVECEHVPTDRSEAAAAPAGHLAVKYRVYHLRPGRAYRFRVRTLKRGKLGEAELEEGPFSTVPVHPSAPVHIELGPGFPPSSSAVVWWEQPLKADQCCVEGYEVQLARLPSREWVTWDGVSGIPDLRFVEVTASAPTSVTVKALVCGLEPAVTYIFRVRPRSRAGLGGWSEPSAQLQTDMIEPCCPASVRVTADIPAQTTVVVSWNQFCAHALCRTATYEVQAALIGTEEWVSVHMCPTQPTRATEEEEGSTFATLVTGLVPGMEYKFRVRAIGTLGGSDSFVLSSAPHKTDDLVPYAPAALDVIGGEDCAHLRWIEPAATDAAPAVGYEVQCAQYPHGEWRPCTIQPTGSGSHPWHAGVTGGTMIERTVLGLEPGAKYKFRVRAITAVGEAPFSADSDVLRLGYKPSWAMRDLRPDVVVHDASEKDAVESQIRSWLASRRSSSSAAALSDEKLAALTSLQTLVALQLRLPSAQSVPASATLKELLAGHGAPALSQMIGTIAKEFGTPPADAEGARLGDLARLLDPGYAQPGAAITGLLEAMFSTKMPAGFGTAEAESYLTAKYGLPAGRVDAIMARLLLSAPASALKTVGATRAFLDEVAIAYASTSGITLTPPNSAGDGGHAEGYGGGDGGGGSIEEVRRSVAAAIEQITLREALLPSLVARGHVAGPHDRNWAAMSPRRAADLLLADDTDVARAASGDDRLQHVALVPLLQELRASRAPPFDRHAEAKQALFAPLLARGIVRGEDDDSWLKLSARDAARLLLESAGPKHRRLSAEMERAVVAIAQGALDADARRAARVVRMFWLPRCVSAQIATGADDPEWQTLPLATAAKVITSFTTQKLKPGADALAVADHVAATAVCDGATALSVVRGLLLGLATLVGLADAATAIGEAEGGMSTQDVSRRLAAAGKDALAGALARRAGWDAVDLDELVAQLHDVRARARA
jgi:hypothetical protein